MVKPAGGAIAAVKGKTTSSGINNNKKKNNSNNKNDVEKNENENDVNTKKVAGSGGSFLTKYFLIILFVFASLSMILNNRYAHSVQKEPSVIGSVLKDFRTSSSNKNKIRKIKEIKTDAPTKGGGGDDDGKDDDDDDGKDDDEAEDASPDKEDSEEVDRKDDDDDDDDDEETPDKEVSEEVDESKDEVVKKLHNGGEQQHKIANLSCEKYGGPSNEEAEEMVYWEDIPSDSLHMSPFHLEHPDNNNNNNNNNEVQSITQFLTFESDHGGFNNIRMAFETVLAMSFATGRTLVLPPHQGMYLIDKSGDTQRNKFSYNHFFHMESISAEHIGLNIISMTEFLEQCLEGKVIDPNNDSKPIYPPNMRTDWDGAPQNEMRELKMWLREFSGENLSHWDPDNCLGKRCFICACACACAVSFPFDIDPVSNNC
jgi:hypothetical protein